MDKKLILYLVILAGLIGATFFSVKSSKEGEVGVLTPYEMTLLENTGHFEIDQNTDSLEPLYDASEGLSDDALGNGEKPSKEVLAAYRKFLGEEKGGSPMLTFGLFIITGIFTGFLIVTYVLPHVVQRASEEVFGSSEKVGYNPLTTAQALVAQGDWNGAINAYMEAAVAEPDNRLPWVEIAMLQLERLEDPTASLATLNEALARGGWRENDEAFFIFRKIEIHESRRGDRNRAIELLREVIERFPQTRHAANANHKLHELGES